MNLIRTTAALLVGVMSNYCLGQTWEDHRWDNWYFGAGGGFTFANGNCGALEGNAATTQNDYVVTISDKNTGELLLYTNGAMRTGNGNELIPATVYDNINLLSPHAVVERPGSGSYYFFHLLPDTIDLVSDSTRLNAIEVAPLANAGDGEVLEHGLSLGTYRGNLFCPIPSLSPDTTWLIASDRRDSVFYRYPITQTGIGSAVHCGSVGAMGNGATGALMKADRTGTRICYVRSLQHLALQRFNRVTATLSDRIELSKDSFNFGYFEFSPNGEKLYVQVAYPGVPDTMPAIFQYDLSTWDIEAVEASRIPVAFAPQFQGGWLQLGPDGKIYSALGAQDSTRIAVIANPNMPGTACGFAPYSVALPEGIAKAEIGSSAICLWWPSEWPLVGLAEQDGPRSDLALQPNPAHDATTVVIGRQDRSTDALDVLDMTGRRILHLAAATASTRIDVSDWPPGCYLVRHNTAKGSVTSARLIVQ